LAVAAEPVCITDGDTLRVLIDGIEDQVRHYRLDAPELVGCGGQVATQFVREALGRNDADLTI
jgi:endonuclease YncB( thermonuclease family)